MQGLGVLMPVPIFVHSLNLQCSVLTGNESSKFQTKVRISQLINKGQMRNTMHYMQMFYHEYRSAVCYAKSDRDALNPSFDSIAQWEPLKSTKMDVCARICKHYLSGDDVSDVEFKDGKAVFPIVNTEGLVKKERKILIYAEFPSMTLLLRQVCLWTSFPS